MTRAEFLQEQVRWAKRMLAVPAENLPGTATHEKIADIMQAAEDELLDHARFTVTPTGMRFSHYE
jgi:hypothetical protein